MILKKKIFLKSTMLKFFFAHKKSRFDFFPRKTPKFYVLRAYLKSLILNEKLFLKSKILKEKVFLKSMILS